MASQYSVCKLLPTYRLRIHSVLVRRYRGRLAKCISCCSCSQPLYHTFSRIIQSNTLPMCCGSCRDYLNHLIDIRSFWSTVLLWPTYVKFPLMASISIDEYWNRAIFRHMHSHWQNKPQEQQCISKGSWGSLTCGSCDHYNVTVNLRSICIWNAQLARGSQKFLPFCHCVNRHALLLQHDVLPRGGGVGHKTRHED